MIKKSKPNVIIARSLYPVLLILLYTGCTTTTSNSDKNSIDNQLAMGIVNSWLDRSISGNVFAAMNLVDDSFYSDSFDTKHDLAQFLSNSIERGLFVGSDVKLDEAFSTIHGELATVQNLQLHAALGTVVAGFELRTTRKGWLITNMTWEMY